MTEPTTNAGFHKIVLGPPANRTDWFAVNVDPIESDLTALRVEDLRNDLLPDVDITYLTEWEDESTSGGDQVRALSTSTGFSRMLLIIAFVLLFVEQLMAWNFLAGVGLLLAFVFSALTWNVWRWNPSLGAILAVTVVFFVLMLGMKFRPAIRSS